MTDETKANLRRFTANWFILSCFVGSFFVYCLFCLVGIRYDVIPTSDGNANRGQHSEFVIRVTEGGDSFYTAAENVSEDVRAEIMGRVYPSPEAATEAVTGPEFSGNAAAAHAVNICTHSDGKVSHQTGAGRHLTWFRFHENGRHYTRTAHQILTFNGGYQTTDTFSYDVSRNYCNCW